MSKEFDVTDVKEIIKVVINYTLTPTEDNDAITYEKLKSISKEHASELYESISENYRYYKYENTNINK